MGHQRTFLMATRKDFDDALVRVVALELNAREVDPLGVERLRGRSTTTFATSPTTPRMLVRVGTCKTVMQKTSEIVTAICSGNSFGKFPATVSIAGLIAVQ